jgi:predicted RNA-binding Zn-ribbon protein involved in translation (DUF1610 family)
MMACNCLARKNDQLAAHNARLRETFYAGTIGPTVTVALEPASDAPISPGLVVVAFYCPFCGEAYDPPVGRGFAGRGHGWSQTHVH